MSRLRRPFLYDRFIFVTVKLLPCRMNLVESDFARLANSFTRMREYAGVSPEEQEQFCGLRIDRVPLPFDVHARI